jgi:hypothetical protein|tara:strand:+ start:503 stop:1699 length:1197 start_codon:yes stop_codon:yes gene_type:complete
MEINNYCSKIYNLCLNPGKTANLVDTNSLFKKIDLLFLRNTDSKNISTEIVPNYHLADGIQLFFNYLSKLLNLNILYLVNYFFYSILILTFGSLLYSFHKSNLNNKFLLTIITTLFFLSNIYLFNYNAEYLIYSVSSILPLIFLIPLNTNKEPINLIYLFSCSFLAIIIFGTMRYYSYLSFLLISLILVLTLKNNFLKKGFFVISIIFLLFIKISIFQNIEEIRKNNIKLANPNFNYEKSIPGNTFYTTFYPGLGFLSNNHVQNGFLDSASYAKKLLPNNYNEKYGNYFITENHYQNIKKEVWNLIFDQPKFILKTIFAKVGVLILYLLITCNFFLINFFLNRKINKIIKYTLLINLGVFAIFPIVSIPSILYSSGFIGSCFCILIISISNFKIKDFR